MSTLSWAPSLKFIKASTPSPHVVHLELARKPVNAFHEPFWREYSAAFDHIASEPDVRAVVVSSVLPNVFTAGLDIKDAAQTIPPSGVDPARRAFTTRQHVLDFQHAISAPERCTVPVIVAIHGIAVGLAIDISLGCDVRYVASDASFSIKEVDVGLAADIGTLARAPKALASSSLLHELAYSARMFNAAEALQVGLVSRVVDGGRDAVVKAALELAQTIATKSPVAIAGTKRFLLHARDHTVEQNLEYSAVWNAAMLQASDLGVATSAFLSKKSPSFDPLQPTKAKL